MFSPGLTFPPRVGGVQLGPIPLSKGVGVPPSVTVDGETFTRIRFGDAFLDVLISSQPLYGRAA